MCIAVKPPFHGLGVVHISQADALEALRNVHAMQFQSPLKETPLKETAAAELLADEEEKTPPLLLPLEDE